MIGRPTTPPELHGATALLERIDRLRARRPAGPVILGITGPPGSGKSTLAGYLHTALERSALVPMDGFHLANAELDRLGLRGAKGAPDTFDAAGYAHALARIRAGETVYVPSFDRHLDLAVAGSLRIGPENPVVLTEGNYLLLDEEPWRQVRTHLDEAWYVSGDDDQRVHRLVERHVRYGRSVADARRWVAEVDEPNARRIATTRHRADYTVDVGDLPLTAVFQERK